MSLSEGSAMALQPRSLCVVSTITPGSVFWYDNNPAFEVAELVVEGDLYWLKATEGQYSEGNGYGPFYGGMRVSCELNT